MNIIQNYIFGYGSLINAESRAKTSRTGKALPVIVKGLKRSWSQAGPKAQITTVGVIWQEEAECNGVLIPITLDGLPKFDKREYGYNRVLLAPTRISAYNDTPIPYGRIWTYLVKDPGLPTQNCPIAQSYVDVTLSGCFQISEKFAKDFKEQTAGWQTHWVNDRKQPKYPRPLDDNPYAGHIDTLLGDICPWK